LLVNKLFALFQHTYL